MRRGFTILELLLAMGIMGMLAVAAAAGYGAMNRGISDRSACTIASSFLRMAQEQASVFRMPTAVYCYNVCLQDANPDVDQPAVVVGVMTGVRRGGRITYLTGSGTGQLLYDEFGDLGTCYGKSDDLEYFDGQTVGQRLFHFNGSGETTMRYSIVSDDVYENPSPPALTVFSGGVPGGQTNLLQSAFYNLGKSKFEPNWKVGDGYGLMFGEVQLPVGYIFGRNIPSRAGEVTTGKTFVFQPDSSSSDSIPIYSTQPNDRGRATLYKEAGEAKADARESL